ncbi:hypothetical protein JCM10914A_02970 [Paenibacillus sp. JCM 10914]
MAMYMDSISKIKGFYFRIVMKVELQKEKVLDCSPFRDGLNFVFDVPNTQFGFGFRYKSNRILCSIDSFLIFIENLSNELVLPGHWAAFTSLRLL